MGRLECLCKFHKVSLPIQRFLGGDDFSYGEMTDGGHQTCIRQWWDKKGAGGGMMYCRFGILGVMITTCTTVGVFDMHGIHSVLTCGLFWTTADYLT